MQDQNRIWIAASLAFLAMMMQPAHALISLSTITVMADRSMSMAITELARDYSREKLVIVNSSFAASEAQSAQIHEGGSADILITPRQAWIDELKTQGLTDVHSQTVVAKGRLALVGPANSPLGYSELGLHFPIAALVTQMGWEPDFVVASPDALAEGAYSKQALRNIGASQDLEPYTLYLKSADEMRDMITRHGAYGVLFYSSALGRNDMRLLGLFPESSHKPINYYAVVIAGDNMDEARKFLDYLKTPGAKAILRRNGFAAD